MSTHLNQLHWFFQSEPHPTIPGLKGYRIREEQESQECHVVAEIFPASHPVIVSEKYARLLADAPALLDALIDVLDNAEWVPDKIERRAQALINKHI